MCLFVVEKYRKRKRWHVIESFKDALSKLYKAVIIIIIITVLVVYVYEL